MRYLRKFNESISDSISKVEEIADCHLADLKDKGFGVIVHQTKDKTGIAVWLGYRGKRFNWEFIKDSYITFASAINDEFSVTRVDAHLPIGTTIDKYTYDDIVDDNISNDDLTYLVIIVKEKNK